MHVCDADCRRFKLDVAQVSSSAIPRLQYQIREDHNVFGTLLQL